MNYDVAIIGAGLSGIAAGIRLAHYGKKVCILERHSLVGGLNSYYRRGGREFDVGLHAMTNFCDPKVKRAPLSKLLRQLRLRIDDFDLAEQTFSTIRFPDVELRFTNDLQDFEASIADAFPAQIDGFRRLTERIREHDSLSLSAKPLSTRAILREYITDRLLEDMILCPLMYYGNAEEHDMEFNQFCIMFQSIFLEGFCRPRRGIRRIIDALVARYKDCGGELRTRCGVRKIRTEDGGLRELVLDDGTELSAGGVLSCAGYPETLRLCDPVPAAAETHPVGQLAFVESIFVLDAFPAELGVKPCITFFSETPEFHYEHAEERVDFRSGVLCAPSNFQVTGDEVPEGILRLTHQADHDKWRSLSADAYRQAKTETLERQGEMLGRLVPDFSEHVVATDMFTPNTITRFTGHVNGTVYGSPGKRRDGTTPVEGLFVCGTDQGFLGIVGSMLSGVSMANLHLLR